MLHSYKPFGRYLISGQGINQHPNFSTDTVIHQLMLLSPMMISCLTKRSFSEMTISVPKAGNAKAGLVLKLSFGNSKIVLIVDNEFVRQKAS
jgi:hypothetical protein